MGGWLPAEYSAGQTTGERRGSVVHADKPGSPSLRAQGRTSAGCPPAWPAPDTGALDEPADSAENSPVPVRHC
ncbi:hypothetical protein DJ56_4233 [Yersinia pestis]|nr:hypothetical protein DJ56_4233 [Yersinia pestis]